MTRTDAGLRATLAVALLLLLLPAAPARADHPRDAEKAAIGRAHMLEHAKIWKAQARARRQWARMRPRERRRARRKIRRGQRVEARAQVAAADAPSDVGSWVRADDGGSATPFVMTSDYQGYAIHAAMLRTGKVLMWGYPIHVDQKDAWRGNESYAWLWDPSKGYEADAVEDVTPVIAGENVSIYCSGMSFLPDGRVLVVGGTLSWGVDDPDDEFTEFAGLDRALLFDPATESWTELPRPPGSHGRWYPTQTLMPDGRTFVISGLSDVAPGGALNDTHEIYSANGQSVIQLDSAAQRRDTELYPHLFAMPDGDLLLAGPDPADSARFDPENLADPWTDLPPLARQRIGGTAVLLPETHLGSSRVALIGGRPYGQSPPAFNEMIDLDASSPSWTTFPGLATQRSYPNTVILPDRSLVTVGGENRDDTGWPPAARAVELYDPVTGSWRTGPSQVETRAYHSTALLLPDGRVLSTGDDYNPVTGAPWDRSMSSPNDTGEIYSPPYLFQGQRPVISSAPESVRWDVPFGVGVAGDIDEAVLIAPAAVTHANDMNQRLVPLRTVNEYPGHGLTLQSPPSANVAPPGYYMLFLVNDGVPSVAKWVRLDSAAPEAPVMPPGADQDTTPPQTTIDAGPTGTVATRSATFEFSSNEAGSTFECRLDSGSWQPCSSPRAYTNLGDGQHTFSVRATDASDNQDTSPAMRTWTVDATGPAVSITSGPHGLVNSSTATFGFTSPEAGATFECNLDSGGWSGCSSPKAYPGLSDGSHTFSVRARDALGNFGASSATRTWTVDTAPPQTSIGGGPTGTVKATSAAFELSSSESNSTFECKLDDEGWRDNCESPAAHSGLEDGSHTFSVRATDPAGNVDPTPASRTWTVDTIAPETQGGTGPSGTVASGSASFTFSSPDWTDGFECRLDGGAWQPCVSPKQVTGLPDGGHSFEARAKDLAGNVDATPVAWSWTVDTKAPETSITAAPGALANSPTATFEFLSPDGASFECRLGSAPWAACSSPRSYSSLTDGSYTFEVRALDAAGNRDATPAAHVWTVDLTAPDATINAGPIGTVTLNSASFEFDSTDDGASFECALDSDTAWEPCDSPEDYVVDDGPHTFRVRARDAAGNVHGTPASRSWTVDATPPDTSITAGPSGTTASSAATFEFASGEPGAVYTCSLDGGAWAACTSPHHLTGLADGPHTLSAKARDANGNEDPSPVTRTWTVDTTAPETSITVAPAGTLESNAAWFEFASDDAAATFECRLDGGAWEGCADGKGYANLAQGGHTFAVRARDPAGNADATPAERSWSVAAPKPAPDPDPDPDPTPGPGPDPDPDPTPDPDGSDPEPDPEEPDDPDAEEPDFAAPVLRLDFAERRWLTRLRRTGRLRVRVTVDEPARVALKLYRGKRRIGRERARIRNADATRRLTLRPRRGALRWLRRSAAPEPRFVVVARDAARNDTRWTRVLKPSAASQRSHLAVP